MAEFAKRVSKNVTGKDDIKIYMSDKYNDVPCNDLESHTEKITFLGDTECDEIYMDLYDGWVNKKQYTKEVKLLEIK